MISARQHELVVGDAFKKQDTPEQLRVFKNGKFLFAAFEFGAEMVMDLTAADPKHLQEMLRWILPPIQR